MVTIGMNYAVLEGKEKAFEAKFKAVLDSMEGAAGHTKTHLFHDVFEPGNYLVVSEWHDKDAFDAFVSSDAFRQVTSWGEEHILRGRPSHQVYGDAADL